MHLRKGMLSVMLMTLAMTAPLRAEVVSSPARALQLMTEARVAAQKCHWLSAGERQELTGYAARAELAAVRREGAAAAKAAVTRGKARGAAGCTPARKELVLAVLQGAREAMHGARAQRRAVASAPRRERPAPRVRRAPARAAAVVASEPRLVARVQHAGWKATTVARQPRARGAVARYRVMATDYYNALKCRNRPQGELMRMWRQVRDLHFAILRAGKRDALARAKAEARRQGNARACR